MDTAYRRCCGMDVHKKSVMVHVLPPQGHVEGKALEREFRTFSRDLPGLAAALWVLPRCSTRHANTAPSTPSPLRLRDSSSATRADGGGPGKTSGTPVPMVCCRFALAAAAHAPSRSSCARRSHSNGGMLVAYTPPPPSEGRRVSYYRKATILLVFTRLGGGDDSLGSRTFAS